MAASTKKVAGWRASLASAMIAAARIQVKGREPLPAEPWEFARRCCWTYDEQESLYGRDPYRRMPEKEYLRLLTAEWEAHKALRVEKSRQILVTHLMSSLHLWLALTRAGVRVAWICKKHDAAEAHLENRVWRMYQKIPATFAKPRARFKNGSFEVYHNPASETWTSRIDPIAAESGKASDAATQLRSETFTAIFWDECDFTTGQSEVYAAGLPCIGAGGRFAMASSANGRTFCWRIGHANVISEGGDARGAGDLAVNRVDLMRGVQAWDLNGFRSVRVHYSADEDKDPETERGRVWIAAVRPRYPGSKWAREMEIDFDVQPGQPVYADGDKIGRGPQAYRPWLPVVCGWDFQYSWPYMFFGQVAPEVDARTGETVGERLHCLKEVFMPNMPLEAFVKNYVAPVMASHFPGARFEHYGDPAGNQRRPESPMSCIQTAAALGINILSRPVKVDTRLQVGQSLISAGLVEIDPVGCPMLLAALSGGYYRDDQDRPVKDGVNDHPADAWGYLVMNKFAVKGEDRAVSAVVPKALTLAARGRK